MDGSRPIQRILRLAHMRCPAPPQSAIGGWGIQERLVGFPGMSSPPIAYSKTDSRIRIREAHLFLLVTLWLLTVLTCSCSQPPYAQWHPMIDVG